MYEVFRVQSCKQQKQTLANFRRKGKQYIKKPLGGTDTIMWKTGEPRTENRQEGKPYN